MPILTSTTLTGRQLDWAVALALNVHNAVNWEANEAMLAGTDEVPPDTAPHWLKHYSSNWADGGPLQDLATMEVAQLRNPNYVEARTLYGVWIPGETILEATARAFALSKIGAALRIPDSVFYRLESRVAE